MDPFDRIRKGDVKFFRKSPEEDVLLNARNDDEESVFSVAVKHNRLKCCQVIVERCPQLLYHQCGIDGFTALPFADKKLLRMVTAEGHTPLHLAVYPKITALSKLLFEADYDFELLQMVDHFGQTSLHIAATGSGLEIVKSVLREPHGKELLRLADNDERTPLHMVIDEGTIEMVRLFT